jgi:hypothetical protein
MPETREVTCIDKVDHYNPHERIKAIGGKDSAGGRWKLAQPQAISAIENRQINFFVNRGGARIDVVVAISAYGHKYLKTRPDGEHENNLLSLNNCPV